MTDTPTTKAAQHVPTMAERTEELVARREHVALGGGQKRQARQHEAGKLTARERVDALLDPGSFQEVGMFSTHQSHYWHHKICLQKTITAPDR